MTIHEFHTELEKLLGLPGGSIKGTEKLTEVKGWDSMATIAFMAMADEQLQAVSPEDLAACRTVADLARLFPEHVKD